MWSYNCVWTEKFKSINLLIIPRWPGINKSDSRELELKRPLLFFLWFNRALKLKWKEKSELIGRMEKEVVEMRNSFKEKEKTLTEERDKAIKAAEYVKHFLFDHS